MKMDKTEMVRILRRVAVLLQKHRQHHDFDEGYCRELADRLEKAISDSEVAKIMKDSRGMFGGMGSIYDIDFSCLNTEWYDEKKGEENKRDKAELDRLLEKLHTACTTQRRISDQRTVIPQKVMATFKLLEKKYVLPKAEPAELMRIFRRMAVLLQKHHYGGSAEMCAELADGLEKAVSAAEALQVMKSIRAAFGGKIRGAIYNVDFCHLNAQGHYEETEEEKRDQVEFDRLLDQLHAACTGK